MTIVTWKVDRNKPFPSLSCICGAFVTTAERKCVSDTLKDRESGSGTETTSGCRDGTMRTSLSNRPAEPGERDGRVSDPLGGAVPRVALCTLTVCGVSF